VGLFDDATLYVFASKAGAPTNPEWYHNLVAHPEVEVEFGDERFDAVATPVSGPERDRLFAAQVVAQPGFAEYEKATERVIPVVELRRA
jgi:deazaflavin-dependent oxidoreductase (nitroreductase family)